ncbi:MAG: PspA/IM30 family protein [Planctomycetota bacterium]
MSFFRDFFGRAGRVVRGQANKGMDSVEDATFEATLKQTVRDMKTELNNVVKASAEAMSHHNRLEAEFKKYERSSADWKEKAKLALEKGNEGLAKKALAKKAECDSQVEALRPGVEDARTASASLKEKVSDLKRRISEAERNAGTLIARRNAAKASKKVSQALAGVGDGSNAFQALDNFEESVKREEAQAKAFDNLSTDVDDDLEKEFAELETSDVDDDLAALKAEMGK